jgi:DNA repair exonuclease SbcCD ATPase subunit
MQAIAAGNPDIKRRIETTNDIAELKMLQREWGYEQAKMRECLETIPAQLEAAQTRLSNVKSDSENAAKVAALEELPFTNERIRGLANQAYANFKNGIKDPLSVGSVGGFDVSVIAVEETRGATLMDITSEIVAKIVVKGDGEYSCEAGVGEMGNNVVRLKNVFAKIIPQRAENAASEVERLTQNLEQAKSQVGVPFEHEEKLVELEKLLEELDEKLSGISKQEDVIADDDELEETKEQRAKREQIYDTDDSDYQPVPDDDDDTPDLPQARGGRR